VAEPKKKEEEQKREIIDEVPYIEVSDKKI